MTKALLDKYMASLAFQVDKLAKGRIFKVREIIGAEEWEKLSLPDRMAIGQQFWNEVKSGTITNVTPVDGKAEQGVQSYKRL